MSEVIRQIADKNGEKFSGKGLKNKYWNRYQPVWLQENEIKIIHRLFFEEINLNLIIEHFFTSSWITALENCKLSIF